MNELLTRLVPEKNIWFVTVRKDGRPHLTPVWFVVRDGKIMICISGRSVKARNLKLNDAVAFSLENGDQPIICEGRAFSVEAPWSEDIVAAFKQKYDWDILTDHDYDLLVEITPEKWLRWN